MRADAKTITIPALFPGAAPRARPGKAPGTSCDRRELNRYLLTLVLARAAILFLGLNLADPLGILPARLGILPFLPFFNILTVALSLGYLLLWWVRWKPRLQLYLHVSVDLVLATVLIAHTRGIESPFISFYLLVIIYCSLTLGQTGGVLAASVSTILYAGIAASGPLGFFSAGTLSPASMAGAFRISVHALGFFAVALLGTLLSQRLTAVQEELEEKIDSLRRLQQLHEHIVSSIRSGLITTDLAGNIAVFNNTAAELTDRPGENALGTPVQEVLGEPFWRKIVANDFFSDLRALRHEEWIEPEARERRCLGFSVSPLTDQEAQLLGYVISFQDLTDIKKLEEEVRLKDRMAVTGRMAAGLAHEIRNPLTAMQGSVEILRSQLRLPPHQDRLLDILMRESNRLNAFIESFLDFARPARFERRPVDLLDLLRDSVTLLRNSPEAREKHVIHLNEESPALVVQGSPGPLQQVFWNLSQNALRAMPAGGELRITARVARGGSAEILFEDTGVGMSPAETEQLFQPFRSGFRGGMGLGLSIVFQIVEDHGGKITFESEKGRGTRVGVSIPLEGKASHSSPLPVH